MKHLITGANASNSTNRSKRAYKVAAEEQVFETDAKRRILATSPSLSDLAPDALAVVTEYITGQWLLRLLLIGNKRLTFRLQRGGVRRIEFDHSTCVQCPAFYRYMRQFEGLVVVYVNAIHAPGDKFMEHIPAQVVNVHLSCKASPGLVMDWRQENGEPAISTWTCLRSLTLRCKAGGMFGSGISRVRGDAAVIGIMLPSMRLSSYRISRWFDTPDELRWTWADPNEESVSMPDASHFSSSETPPLPPHAGRLEVAEWQHPSASSTFPTEGGLQLCNFLYLTTLFVHKCPRLRDADCAMPPNLESLNLWFTEEQRVTCNFLQKFPSRLRVLNLGRLTFVASSASQQVVDSCDHSVDSRHCGVTLAHMSRLQQLGLAGAGELVQMTLPSCLQHLQLNLSDSHSLSRERFADRFEIPLPQTLTALLLEVDGNGVFFDGFDTFSLPRGIMHLRLPQTCHLTNEALRGMPPHLVRLELRDQHSTADDDLDLLLLPASVTELRHVKLSRRMMSRLPPNLTELHAYLESYNLLSTLLSPRNLPHMLTKLHIFGTNLRAAVPMHIDTRRIPFRMEEFVVHGRNMLDTFQHRRNVPPPHLKSKAGTDAKIGDE
jgi:hypothetical protein